MPTTRFSALTILPFVLDVGLAHGIAMGQQAPSGPSETASVRTITLEEAIALANVHQPEMHAALSRIAAQKVAADVPRAQWLPTFGVTAQLFGATANNTT